jgi:hypothetical protein
LDKSDKVVIFEVLRKTGFILWLSFLTLALAKEPGDVAIDFLEKARDRKLEIKSNDVMVLSAHITREKREWIEKSIERLAEQIGKGKLSVGEVKMDGDFAAVMVRQSGGDDQFHLQVFPVALVKGEKGWRAAPILASFENAVFAYTVSIRESLSVLEDWMMQQRVSEIENLMKQASERLRRDIKSAFQDRDTKAFGLEDVFKNFQKAYQEGRQLEVLGYLGGYSEQWPDDWEERLNAIQVASNPKTNERHPWRLLASEDVLRVVVNQEVDGDEGMLSVACLDPSWVGAQGVDNEIQVIHFTFQKDSADRWVIGLPESLMNDDAELFYESQGMDNDLLDLFPKFLRKDSPAHQAQSYAEAEREVIEELESGKIENLLRWVDFSEDSARARRASELATKHWWSIHAPGMFRVPVKMGEKVKGDWAVSVYQWFSLSQGERFELIPFYFKKTANGWVWVPGPRAEIDRAMQEEFSIWMAVEEKKWRDNSSKQLMEPIVELDRLSQNQNVDETELKKLTERWITAIEKKNIRELFSMSARLGGEGPVSHKIFRNLAYQLGMAQRVDSEMTGIYRTGNWVAAGLAHGKGKERFVSFLLIVPTESGLKVLSEIDLIAEDNRTRKFLNKVSMDRLKPFVTDKEMEEIKGLFEEFEKKIRN